MMVISDIRPKGEWSHLYFILSSSFGNIFFFCISFSEKKWKKEMHRTNMQKYILMEMFDKQ